MGEQYYPHGTVVPVSTLEGFLSFSRNRRVTQVFLKNQIRFKVHFLFSVVAVICVVFINLSKYLIQSGLYPKKL